MIGNGDLYRQIGIFGGFWFIIATALLTLYLGAFGCAIAIRNTRYWIKDRLIDREYKKLINRSVQHEVE